MVTMSLFVMLSLLSLVVDLGWAYFRREAAQSAADAAAVAAIRAVELAASGTPVCGSGNVWCGSPAGTLANCPAAASTTVSTSFDNACVLAAANGFTTTGSKTVSVQANTTSPAPTVPGSTVSYWVTVRIDEASATFFGGPFISAGAQALTSKVIATAGITSSGGSTDSPCIYVLSPHGTDAFNLGNGAQVTTSSCGVYVNSDASTAMLVNGGAKLSSDSVKIVGGYQTNNGAKISSVPSTGVAVAADPFANLPAPPTPSGCSSGSFTNWQPTAYTLSAGCYNGFSVGNGMSAVMSPGTYVVNGGTFSIQGGSSLTTTGGVMVYLTNGATVNIANGANVTMTAQSSGTWEGVLFYQDRTMTSPNPSTFAGGASMNLSGALYFPNSLLNVDNGSAAQVAALIVASVNFQGGAHFKQASSQSQTGLQVSTSVVSLLQ